MPGLRSRTRRDSWLHLQVRKRPLPQVRPWNLYAELQQLRPNRAICAIVVGSSLTGQWANIRRSGCANIFQLGRRGLAVLPPDSAKDHETLHTYSLPGIVMRGRNTLLSA